MAAQKSLKERYPKSFAVGGNQLASFLESMSGGNVGDFAPDSTDVKNALQGAITVPGVGAAASGEFSRGLAALGSKLAGPGGKVLSAVKGDPLVKGGQKLVEGGRKAVNWAERGLNALGRGVSAAPITSTLAAAGAAGAAANTPLGQSLPELFSPETQSAATGQQGQPAGQGVDPNLISTDDTITPGYLDEQPQQALDPEVLKILAESAGRSNINIPEMSGGAPQGAQRSSNDELLQLLAGQPDFQPPEEPRKGFLGRATESVGNFINRANSMPTAAERRRSTAFAEEEFRRQDPVKQQLLNHVLSSMGVEQQANLGMTADQLSQATRYANERGMTGSMSKQEFDAQQQALEMQNRLDVVNAANPFAGMTPQEIMEAVRGRSQGNFEAPRVNPVQ